VFHGVSSFTEQTASPDVTSGSSVSSIVSVMYGYILSVSVQYLIGIACLKTQLILLQWTHLRIIWRREENARWTSWIDNPQVVWLHDDGDRWWWLSWSLLPSAVAPDMYQDVRIQRYLPSRNLWSSNHNFLWSAVPALLLVNGPYGTLHLVPSGTVCLEKGRKLGGTG